VRRTRFAYLVLLAAFFLPFLYGRAETPENPAASAAPPPVSETVRLLVGQDVRELPLEDYLVGVLAGEMPASFEPEALKAQAVAARTYTLSCARSHKHGEADICADPAHCQAWLDEAAMRKNWGENYERNRARLAAAVTDTAGRWLAYEGEPIFAAFHASSAGATEDCGAVWNPRPYLVSVPSPESAETVPNYVTVLRCAVLDFRDTLLATRPGADFSAPPESWIGSLDRDGSGRVASVTLGGAVFTGVELRRLFSLRSTAFTLAFEGGQFCFTVTGSGHGVGMSQYGANVMAGQGADWREIVAHYYPGAVLNG